MQKGSPRANYALTSVFRRCEDCCRAATTLQHRRAEGKGGGEGMAAQTQLFNHHATQRISQVFDSPKTNSSRAFVRRRRDLVSAAFLLSALRSVVLHDASRLAVGGGNDSKWNEIESGGTAHKHKPTSPSRPTPYSSPLSGSLWNNRTKR